jgi:hypothetical protein
MDIYAEKSQAGEFWLRDPLGNKNPANIVLEDVYAKYATPNQFLSAFYSPNDNKSWTFFTELTSNQVTRFDVFHDCLFIETPSGCIFEKITTEGDKIKPYTLSNFFTAKHSKIPGSLWIDTKVGYWYSEEYNKIYFCYIINIEENKNYPMQFSLVLVVNEFDCATSNIKTVLFDKVVFVHYGNTRNWDIFDILIETPVMSFNTSTRKYNVSFLLKNKNRQFGLVSINFINAGEYENGRFTITEVNGHLPFFDLTTEDCVTYPYNANAPQPFHIVTVGQSRPVNQPQDPAYNYRWIKLTLDQYGYPELATDYTNYLVTE